ncbi:hypothetical protein GT354_46675 [Streptomyces sp. SID3343]|nr:hypothetical protein [Streptomyces sp. SID3343]
MGRIRRAWISSPAARGRHAGRLHAGLQMDDPKSVDLVRQWIGELGPKKMADHRERNWSTFNKFFSRELAPGARPIDGRLDPGVVVAPTDCVIDMIVERGCRGSGPGRWRRRGGRVGADACSPSWFDESGNRGRCGGFVGPDRDAWPKLFLLLRRAVSFACHDQNSVASP